MKSISVFDYSDPVSYICELIDSRKQKNPSYSLRSCAKSLGYATPSYLSQVTRRKKLASMDLAQRLKKIESLTSHESAYLDALILSQKSSVICTKAIASSLGGIDSSLFNSNISSDAFELISDWYNILIFEATKLAGFDGDIRFLIKKFKSIMTFDRIQRTITRLAKLGFIKGGHEAPIERLQNKIIALDGTPSNAIRTYHKQMLDLAVTAIDRQEIYERHLQGSTIAIRKEDYPELVKAVNEFHEKIAKLESCNSADFIYQVEVVTFKLI